jgi:hypothetical protein
MNSVTGAPVTAAIFAALTIFLSGCIAYDAAGAAVVSTAGTVVTAPFGGGDFGKTKSN